MNSAGGIGTEYLVKPVGRPGDEEDASDFEPEKNGKEEDVDEEDEDVDKTMLMGRSRLRPFLLTRKWSNCPKSFLF